MASLGPSRRPAAHADCMNGINCSFKLAPDRHLPVTYINPVPHVQSTWYSLGSDAMCVHMQHAFPKAGRVVHVHCMWNATLSVGCACGFRMPGSRSQNDLHLRQALQHILRTTKYFTTARSNRHVLTFILYYYIYIALYALYIRWFDPKQAVLSVRHLHHAQPIQHVCQLHSEPGGHYRGHPEAGGYLSGWWVADNAWCLLVTVLIWMVGGRQWAAFVS
jgi:hypothetical protein